MTTKTTVEREQVQTKNQQSLKGALAGILEKSKQKAPERAAEAPKPAAPAPQAEAPKREPVAAAPVPAAPPQPPVPEPRENSPAQAAGAPEPERKPFEIPEEKLRQVLKGEA